MNFCPVLVGLSMVHDVPKKCNRYIPIEEVQKTLLGEVPGAERGGARDEVVRFGVDDQEIGNRGLSPNVCRHTACGAGGNIFFYSSYANLVRALPVASTVSTKLFQSPPV